MKNKHIWLDEKLRVLRQTDARRQWLSLDDRRVCAVCDRVITGRMIDVWRDTRGHYHLHCPTAGCTGSPRDWLYHGPIHRPANVAEPTIVRVLNLGALAS
jgi:hypothetical protein